MKKYILATFMLGMVGICASAACSVGVGDGGDGSCDAVSCGDALASGLSAAGEAICDSVSDTAYGNLQDCACPSGPCADVCNDNFCADLGQTSDCGDCLNANCGPEFDDCGNN